MVGKDKFTYAKFVVALAKYADKSDYGGPALQLAVEPLCAPKNDKDRELGEQFWADLPDLIKEHKIDRSFWFDLHKRYMDGRSYLQRRHRPDTDADTDTYQLQYPNAMTSYWNRTHSDRPVHTTVDPHVLRMVSADQKRRLNPHFTRNRNSKEAWNALELATHAMFRYLHELTDCGPVTLPTINGKNPLSEKIAELAKQYDVKFDPATNTFA